MTAREQAREAAVEHLGNERTPYRQEALWAADAASDVLLSLTRRFITKVTFSEKGCWLWHGSKRPGGYGQISLGGHQGTLVGAHVVAYELFVGEIPEGHQVCHSCDNPSCVRPDHLFTGTRSDNMQDASAKGRFADRPVRRGEQSNLARLTDEQVAAIRESAASTSDLAVEYDVHRTTIQRIRNGTRRTPESPEGYQLRLAYEAGVDAASDLYEPLVRDLHNTLAFYDRTSALDPATRRSMARQRSNVLRRATEALDA